MHYANSLTINGNQKRQCHICDSDCGVAMMLLRVNEDCTTDNKKIGKVII